MENILLGFLKSYKNKLVSLIEIEKNISGNIEYIDFANIINEFVDMNILSPVKAHGTNNKKVPLANTYRINKSYFYKEISNKIIPYQSKFHPNINLDSYYLLDRKTWEKDLPHIEKIDLYLKNQGLPQEEIISQQCSYNITGNEKWIDEEGGRQILERIGLIEDLKIISEPDPLMLAINRSKICNSKEHHHLIVENKATFYGLIDDIQNTKFTSLVYGAGWKVLGGISIFEKQLGLAGEKNTIYYFGDLDLEGISIWNSLNNRSNVIVATDFYDHLLKKPSSFGKENQHPNKEAIDQFLLNFNSLSEEKIMNTLKKGRYYPQEALNKEELQAIWRKIG